MIKTALRREFVLAGLLILWGFSIVLVTQPNYGISTPIYPVTVQSERMILFIVSAALSVVYSLYMGLKWIKSEH